MNKNIKSAKSIDTTMELCIEQILEQDIKSIVNRILSLVKKADAIYLAGGYGRNEGAWIPDGDKYKPYNDYDFVLFTDDIIERKTLNELRKECSQMVDIKWVDIDVYNSAKLNHLKPTQKNIDILNGSKLVYGTDLLKDKKIKIERLGLKDIKEQYFTRLWTFYGTAILFEKQTLTTEDVIFIKYQLSKAILSSIDCILIKNGKYVTSYKEKVQRIIESELFPEYNHLFQWALNQKLRPTTSMDPFDDINLLYQQTAYLYRNMMNKAFGYYWAIISRPRLYRYYNMISLKNLAYRLFCILKRKSLFAKKIIGIRSLQNEIFQKMYTDEECSVEWICDELVKLGFTPNSAKTNNQALNEVAIARSSI